MCDHESCSNATTAVPAGADLGELGDRIAELSAQIQAATYHLLVMIREFDERGGWGSGFRSCAHWLQWRTGLDLGAAREKVRVAKALGELPLLSEAMRRGEVSYSKVRALTRVATPEHEEELLDFARAGTTAHVEKLVRLWRRTSRLAEAQRDELRRESRSLQAYTDEDGMVVLRARLEPEVGAALLKAIEAAEEVLFEEGRERERQGAEVGNRDRDREEDGRGQAEEITASQRRADAIGLVAESALAAGLDTGNRGDRFQVVVHVDAAVLAEGESEGVSALEGEVGVSAETSRRLACDASKVLMTHDDEGRILDVGRKTRTIHPALRRALVHRDGGCCFPGCGIRFCEAHHIEHWADGGPTSLENTLLLCRLHHRAVHEEGFQVEKLANGDFRFRSPWGEEIPASPPAVPLAGDGLRELTERLVEDGVAIDPWTGVPTWEGQPVDYRAAIEYFA